MRIPEVQIPTEISKVINSHILIKFWQKLTKQEVPYFILRSTNLLILFGIRNNCLHGGRNILL